MNLYTDGACSGNPGPGGWGAVLECDGHRKELSGGEASTTNNRMELTAVIEGLAAKYVIDAITKGWVYSWKRNGWKKADKSPALNVDLWERLLSELSRHEMTFCWVKGHAGHPENERCDQMAVAESHKFR